MTWHPLTRIVLRRTGFPFDTLEGLAVADTTLITQARELRDDAAAADGEALGAFRPAVDAAGRDGDRATLRALSKLRRAVATGHLSHDRLTQFGNHVPPDLADLLTRCVAAHTAADQAMDRLRAMVASEQVRIETALREAMADPLFAQAIFLSNPDMYVASIAPLSTSEGPLSPALKRAGWSYLQRFAGKNDTASFFGPLNYATIVHGRPADAQDCGGTVDHVRVSTRPGRWRRREVFISFWAVQSLARRIAEDPAVRPWLRPRRHPMARLSVAATGEVIAHRAARHRTLPTSVGEIALLVDGCRTVAEIADTARVSIDDVSATIDRLVAAGLVLLGVEVPSTRFHPLSQLIEEIRQLDPRCDAKGRWLALLTEMDRIREQMRDGTFEDRLRLVPALDDLFAASTGISPRRNPGATYADRTLFYEECEGTHEQFDLTSEFAAEVVRRLEPILDVSAVHAALLQKQYRRLAAQAFDAVSPNGDPVPYTVFSHHVMALQQAGSLDATGPDVERFRDAFSALVTARSDGHVATLTEGDLIELLGSYEKPSNCHVSPDIMFAARDLTELKTGNYTLVLGEVHQVVYAWGSQLYFDTERHRTENECAEHIAAMPDYRGMAIVLTERKHKGLLHDVLPGTFIEVGAPASRAALARVAIADIDVTLESDGVTLRHRETGERYVLYMAGDEQLHLWMLALPRVMPVAIRTSPTHTPRIVLGTAVYQRERWTTTAADWGSDLGTLDDAALLVRADAVRARFGMPRYLYLHVASEPKPYYVDLQAPLGLRLLQHLARHNDDLTVTEMLPGPDELWLQEPDGRYCSEFRMTLFKYPTPQPVS